MANRLHRLGLGLAVALVLWPATALAGDGPAFRYSLVDRIGASGDGPGEFTPDAGPVGITVDHLCGDIYVSDEAKQRIQRFDMRGKFVNFIGEPAGEDFIAEGELSDPRGLDFYTAVYPQSYHGPPMKCTGFSTLSPFLWVADLIANRIAIFEPGGSWEGSWCHQDLSVGGCDLVDSSDYDYYPTDVDVLDSRVYIAGVSSDWVREYDRNGTYIRRSEPAVDGAYSISASGGALWASERFDSAVGLYDLNPVSPTIDRYHRLGADFSSAKGKFTYVTALTTAPNLRLFVLDNDDRVLTFMPSGRYLNEFELPPGAVGEDIVARFDKTLFIADNSRERPGILVYSPGPLVSLFMDALGDRRVEITGKVKSPLHPGDKLKLERLASDGWNRIAKVRLDGESRYKFFWKAPRDRTYVVRAFFRDPHDFHDDRSSRYKNIRVK